MTEIRQARFPGLHEAALRIGESLDLDRVLLMAIESACRLTSARRGALVAFDESGGIRGIATHGFGPVERDRLDSLPAEHEVAECLTAISAMVDDSLAGSEPPCAVDPSTARPEAMTCLQLPLVHKGKPLGLFFIGAKQGARGFTQEDEDTVTFLSAHTATAAANCVEFSRAARMSQDLEALVNIAPVGVLVFDAESSDLVLRNHETRRLVGNLRLPGRSLDQLLEVMTLRSRENGRQIEVEDLPIARVLRSGEPVRSEEIVIELPDGRSITTLVNAAPIYGEDGEIVSVVATLQDITPLQELERLRSEFLGMVSHELRTPLATIKGSATTALMSASALSDMETLQFFSVIDEQADHMRELISNLLDASQIEAGMLSVNPEPTDLLALVDRTVRLFRDHHTEHRVEVDPPQGLRQVMADGKRVTHVINNLLDNAVKNSPANSAISLTLVQQELQVEVSITDRGRGVAPERLESIFGKSGRADDPDGDGRGSGTGLGLAICRGIVEAHGGRIWAESDGEGTGVRVAFTLTTAEESMLCGEVWPTQEAGSPRQFDGCPTKVLVVDDDPHELWLVRHILEEGGYVPVLTSDPRDVEDLIRAENPGLILTDLIMPGLDGFELMKRIPAITDAPTIFLSGYGRDQMVAEALDLGAADYIVKPFSATELLARIRSVLRRVPLRAQVEKPDRYLLGTLSINYAEREVLLGDDPVQLTPTEYRLLCELAENAGRIITYDHLLESVWGSNAADPSTVRGVVKWLRRKLGDSARHPTLIMTERNVGYRMTRPR